jgi:predicted metal-dependent hydrolase
LRSSQSGWIWQRLAPELPSEPADLHGLAITIRGVQHLVEVSDQTRGVPVHIQDLPSPTLKVRGAREHMPRRIIDFMKREARCDLERASDAYAGRWARLTRR